MKIIAQCSVHPPRNENFASASKNPLKNRKRTPTAALYSTRKLEPAPSTPRTTTPATPRAAQSGPGSHLSIM